MQRRKLYDSLSYVQKEQHDWSKHGGPLRHNSRLFAEPPITAALQEATANDESMYSGNSTRLPSLSDSDAGSAIQAQPSSSADADDEDSIRKASAAHSTSEKRKLKPIPPPSKRRNIPTRPIKHRVHPTNLDRANLMYRTRYMPDGRSYIVTDLQDEFVPVLRRICEVLVTLTLPYF